MKATSPVAATKEMTMTNVNLTQVANKIDELSKHVATYKCTEAESRAAQEDLRSMIADGSFADNPEKMQSILDLVGMANALDDVERLAKTMTLDLMHCPKRYVVSSSDSLQSPAGFHPDERVFVSTKIAFNTDSLVEAKKFRAKSAWNLFIHEVK